MPGGDMACAWSFGDVCVAVHGRDGGGWEEEDMGWRGEDGLLVAVIVRVALYEERF